MPTDVEIHDFEPIAELRKYFIDDGPARGASQNALLDQIVRLVWNARGAADIGKAELLDEAPAQMVVAAIRSVDR